MTNQFAIGIDYGTNSVRALVVDLKRGKEIASHAYDYPSGENGVLLDPNDPNLARQNPADYIVGFTEAVGQAVQKANMVEGFSAQAVVGLGVDTTGSTPIPVDERGMPLALLPEFRDHLSAQAWLWKDHTSYAEAAEITDAASHDKAGYLDPCGGVYSSEWYWSKLLHCQRVAPKVFDAAYAWVELADFIPAYLTGTTEPSKIQRGVCAAGHKAMYNDRWGGMPTALLNKVEPALVPLAKRFAKKPTGSEHKAGDLLPQIAKQVGLPAGLPVAVGALDAHMGAVGAGVKPGTMVKILGTSACDICVWPIDDQHATIPGVCGVVAGSVQRGMYGIEAGQPAVGDLLNWFVRNLAPQASYQQGDAHDHLTRQADQLKPGASGLLALDWNNGNRSVLVDPLLTGLIMGQTLHTTAAEVYRALAESTAFGALTIINRFEQYGIRIDEVINCGGIAEKSDFVMQLYADICNRPMKISRSGQTCALGAAIFGAVAAGAFPDVSTAQANLVGIKPKVFHPRKQAAAVYAELYKLYQQLHNAFGTGAGPSALSHLMKDLIKIRQQARA